MMPPPGQQRQKLPPAPGKAPGGKLPPPSMMARPGLPNQVPSNQGLAAPAQSVQPSQPARPVQAQRPAAARSNVVTNAARPVATIATAPMTTAQPPALPSNIGSDLPPGVASVVEAIKMFDQVLAEENVALGRYDASGVAALQDRKVAVTRLYQERLRALLKDGGMNPGSLGMTPDQRTKVIALVEAFERRMAHNTALLKAGMNSIERLFQAVNDAMLKTKTREVAYTKVGQMANRLSTGAAALAFNQSV